MISSGINSRPEFLGNLQVLRAYAAANVMLVHLVLSYHAKPAFGLYGVDLFFVLSGFIMARISAQDPSRFLTRRMIRIIPFYWLCTIGLYLLASVRPDWLHSTRPDPGNLTKSLLFIPYRKESGAVQPLLFLGWTLNYEMFFYLIFGLILKFRCRKPALCVAAILALLTFLGSLFAPTSVPTAFYSAPIILEFALGILVWQLTVKPWSIRGVPAFAIGLLAFCFCLLPLVEMTKGLAYRQFLLGLPAAGVVLSAVLLQESGWGVKNRFFLLIGNASFVLYLTHTYVLQIAEKCAHPDRWNNLALRTSFGLCLVGLCLLAAVVAHVYIELPLIRVLKGFFLPRRSISIAKPQPAPSAVSV